MWIGKFILEASFFWLQICLFLIYFGWILLRFSLLWLNYRNMGEILLQIHEFFIYFPFLRVLLLKIHKRFSFPHLPNPHKISEYSQYSLPPKAIYNPPHQIPKSFFQFFHFPLIFHLFHSKFLLFIPPISSLPLFTLIIISFVILEFFIVRRLIWIQMWCRCFWYLWKTWFIWFFCLFRLLRNRKIYIWECLQFVPLGSDILWCLRLLLKGLYVEDFYWYFLIRSYSVLLYFFNF